MGSEPFGPFAIEPAWRRRGPTAQPFALENPPDDLPIPVRATATPVSRATAVPAVDLPAADLPALDDVPPVPVVAERLPPRDELALPELVPANDEPEVIFPVRVNPPPPEEVPAPSPFKPDPAHPPQVTRRKARRRHRRPWAEALVPYLAAVVGLIALGGAIWLDRQNQERFAAIATELSGLRADVGAALAEARKPAPAPAPAKADDGTVDALLALQTRIAALEEAARAAAAAPVPDAAAPATTGSVPVSGQSSGPLKTQLADSPTTDCIPLGTRFLMTAGDSYPICRTPEVVKVSDVTMEGIVLAGGKAVSAGASTTLKFGDCTLAVLSTDLNGFAELEATCR
jgi:hypothetical protein